MLELRVVSEILFASILFSIDNDILNSRNISLHNAFGYKVKTWALLKRVGSLSVIYVAGCALTFIQLQYFPQITSRAISTLTLTVAIANLLSNKKFVHILTRVATGRISDEFRLGDILLSDGFVSLSGVLVDIAVCVNLAIENVPMSDTFTVDVIGPKIQMVACIPATIRMSQCIIDFRRSKDVSHLFNFLKYSVSNTVNLMRVLKASDTNWFFETNANVDNALRLALFVNAFYSLYWDLVMDWKLGRLTNSKAKLSSKRLQHSRCFPLSWYFIAVIADSLLRFTFLISTAGPQSVYMLQILEILRRAIWVLFRVESEGEKVIEKPEY
ncbi:Erd1 protein [Starmerella bacillaris]|uniref:Erd1 protein n=1 Tax=Starmerella bacillaris TaxID=1247836 RepID=A0AAV5RIS0_STABA|nr:Erd1 protein [Starmerella bacillaris]